MEKVQLPSGMVEWAMYSMSYVKNAVKVVEALMPRIICKRSSRQLPRNPFPSG
jgi:hypothetical protein